MGTISDKLMRIINTKEDIRQALISKGYDVPTSIPFKEYAKMISDLPCRVDSFPDIEGIVARYSALGLTNEQMAANPVWVDKTGNGHDLQMKNLAWGGMSGVGGYVQNFNDFKNNATVDKVRIDEQSSNSVKVTILATVINNAIYIPKNIYQFNKSYFIKISSEGYNEGDLSLSFYAPSTSTATTVKVPLNPNGITEIPAIKEDDFLAVYLCVDGKVGSITIEQLPLYPGFILGDGVDDEAATIDNLDLEDTYTVYTPLILLKYGGVVSGKSSAKDFSLNTVVSSKSIGFDSANAWSGSIPVDLFEFALVVCKRDPKTMYVKDLITGKANQRNSKEFVPNPGKYFIWRNTGGSWCQVAIAGQIICNGHFSTDEDDEKVLDWYKKQYPWLFFDQAWTVTGKTNEDEDRATIANITGNGNDLVLSNFAFSGNSGYGLYNIQKFTNWSHVADRGDIVKNGYSVTITNSKITSSSTNYNTDILYSYNSSSTTIIFKVTGLVDGQKIFLGRKSVTDAYVIDKDGIYRSDYNIPQKDGKVIVGIGTVGFTGECNITIEQIPEYEGYLVTDGVDDKVVSAESIAFTDTWTIITDTVFLGKVSVASGILASNIFTVYNYQGSGTIAVTMGEGGSSLRVITSSIKAFSSDGTIYDAEWNEYHVEIGTIRALERLLKIGTSSNETSYFCQLAFKFLGIYNNQILSKDDCIKAYNYLQTLKAK